MEDFCLFQLQQFTYFKMDSWRGLGGWLRSLDLKKLTAPGKCHPLTLTSVDTTLSETVSDPREGRILHKLLQVHQAKHGWWSYFSLNVSWGQMAHGRQNTSKYQVVLPYLFQSKSYAVCFAKTLVVNTSMSLTSEYPSAV